eukprot:TRINITY_DN3494_c0_g1_i1.p1 TRINITY_DN3494_c0_g1~~TRINITY_DN3494_c0_g1_i1.p1  ORF type:complete len:279 (-),score=27.26 TRINITY_DN3494_c0_g1_i1:60-896(-)
MNSYNSIVNAPTAIQAVPHGCDEVVSAEFPPPVEYANRFRTIEALEEHIESLADVPIDRPSKNFIFTEAADNYSLSCEKCPFCSRYFPHSMNSRDRGRHSFKICPSRPVKCELTGTVLTAKEFLYLFLWTNGSQDAYNERYETSADERLRLAEANASLWEETAEAVSRREQLALIEWEQRSLWREREVEMERLREREARIEALEREREAHDALRHERAARLLAEQQRQRAEESARVWEEATDVLARRDGESGLRVSSRGQLPSYSEEELHVSVLTQTD